MNTEPAATVSHERCVGVGMCAQQAPGAFAFDADGLSVFLPGGEWTQDELVDAADSCPTMAISLRLGSGSGGQDA